MQVGTGFYLGVIQYLLFIIGMFGGLIAADDAVVPGFRQSLRGKVSISAPYVPSCAVMSRDLPNGVGRQLDARKG